MVNALIVKTMDSVEQAYLEETYKKLKILTDIYLTEVLPLKAQGKRRSLS